MPDVETDAQVVQRGLLCCQSIELVNEPMSHHEERLEAAHEALDRILAELARVKAERDAGIRREAKYQDVDLALRADNTRLREALEQIAVLADGQEERTAQTMMMHGFSPVKALGQSVAIARAALDRGTAP